MAVPVGLVVCVGIAVLIINLTLWHLIDLYRRPEPGTIEDAIQRTARIIEAFCRVSDLEGRESEELGRQIARDIRDNCETLIALIDGINYRKETTDRDEAAFNLSMAARCQALGVYWRARWILFLFRFRPSRVRDGRRLAETALQHSHTWKAYLQFLKAQYPEKLEQLTIPE